ncbi:MAG TPA: flagellar hook assembly protein FlgD [Sphingomonas sp.]|nr:flagellar hook assembly protein FlgD [Sphingomonas sp.]
MSFDTTLANLGVGRYGSAASTTPTTTTAAAAQSMDQGDFLTLMTAQLKNQDPFEPVDNTQMVAQMAQFSSLAGISEMNTTLKAISDRLGTSNPNDALNWVGRTVMTEGATAYPRTGGGIEGAIELDAAASNVTVTIQGPNGETLRTVDLGAQPKGTINYDWDGSTDAGEDAGAGPFTVKVSAQDANGGKVVARNLVWAPVASVTLGSDGSPILTLPGVGQVPITAVRKIG